MNKHRIYNAVALVLCIASAAVLTWYRPPPPDYASAAAQQAAQEQAAELRKEKAEMAINESEKQK